MLAPAIALLIAATSVLGAIPPEPGTRVLTDAPVFQAVAADVDGDGAREVVLLTAGDGTSILAEAWRDAGEDGWGRIGPPIEVVPRDAGEQGVARWIGAPLRLVVRRVDGLDRVTVVRLPQYAEPGLAAPCCLLLHDLVLAEGRLSLVQVAAPADAVDAIHALDLDGDGTDELVASRSVPPVGDITYRTDAYLHRWTGDRFEVELVQLPSGSGDTPFILGETDGRPGDELGIIATLGRPDVHRVALDDDGRLAMEDAGIVATDAAAVPLPEGQGIAFASAHGIVSVHTWPGGGALSAPLGVAEVADADLLGVPTVNGVPRLVARERGADDRLHVLDLPGLSAAASVPPLTRSAAAERFASGPVIPYVGRIPRGDPEGRPAILYGGYLLSADASADPGRGSVVEAAVLAGAQPIGFVGRGGETLALLHAAVHVAAPDPSGGALTSPVVNAVSSVTLAPLAEVVEPEVDEGVLEPPVTGSAPLPGDETIAVGPGGFRATVDAPPGTRVYVAGADPSVVAVVHVVPDSGRIEVPMAPPMVQMPEPRYRAVMGVTTPAGHSYLATWDVRVLTEPPPLRAAVRTPFGSGDVEVSGRSAPYAEVRIAGERVALDADGRFTARTPAPPWPTEIDVTATDPFGNATSASVSGVGWFDYRGLPWIPIVVALVGAAAALLYLRVPPATTPARRDDDAALEDVEPD